MKKVIYGDELIEKMRCAVDLICDTVGSTLGPIGSNVLINCSDTTPYITNDGVTIAKNIESEDICINSILEIIKEASLKTNEVVGDGTTTTLVLLKSIFNQGIELIKSGINQITIKEQLSKALEKVIEEINNISIKPTKNHLKSVACISSGDEEIGNIVSEVYNNMNNKYSIKIEEGNHEYTYYEVKKGYNIDIDNISPMYFRYNDVISLNDCYIVVLKGYLTSLDNISDIINDSVVNNRNVVIFVEDYDDSIKEELLVYYLSEHKNIFIFKLPEYASRREKIEEDISILSSCRVKNINYEEVSFNDLSCINNIKITREEVIIGCDNSEKLITKLNGELMSVKNDYDREFIESRLSKLENGQTTIYVGGITKTEIREKIMRYEDALCATEVAKYGVVPGEGISLLNIIDKLGNSIGDKILRNALIEPFKIIINNFGKDSKKMYEEIKKYNYKKIYNYNTDKLEDIKNTSIIDPTKVVIESIKNSISVARMLLTIEYLVVNENIVMEKSYI